MNVLLAGHEGYVGSGLFAYFRGRHRVVGWGRREDLLSLTPAILAREKIDVVVNCAVLMDRAVAPYAIDGPTDWVNVEGARHLVRILKGTSIGWFQISTREVFGPVYGPRDAVARGRGDRPAFLVGDDRPFAPETVYAKSKLMAELISESHPRSNVVRLSTCYTDFDHPRGNWMTKLIKAALTGRPAPLTRSGRQFRDPLHCDDLGSLIEALAKKNIYGEKLNAGGGRKNILSVREFLDLVDRKASVEKISGGDYGFAFDNRKASRLTGWKPAIMIRDRIATMIENVRRGLSSAKK
ncbi:MAG: NAD-dependent epimerase/dehydratase family protein [Elusimicrobiota bacterium]